MNFFTQDKLSATEIKNKKIIKWDITKAEKQANSEALYQFFLSLGLTDEDEIEISFDKDFKTPSEANKKTFFTAKQKLKVSYFKETLISDLKINTSQVQGKQFNSYLKTQNEKGYVIYFSVCGSRDKENRRFTVQYMDFDTGKDTKYFDDKTEAEEFASNAKGKDHVKRVLITPNYKKGTSQIYRYSVVVYYTDEYIATKKQEFLNEYGELLKDATIVESKNGFHIYLKSSGVLNDDTYQALQEAFARRFNTDSNVTDASRVTRVPFFAHTKDPSNPFFVKVLQFSSERVFAKEDFINEFDLVFEEKKIKSAEKEVISRSRKGIETKTVKVSASTALEMKETFDLAFSDKKLSFIEFVEEIKQFPLTSFYKNPELEPQSSFCCHFHDDKKPSAATFEMYDGTHIYFCHSDACKKQRTIIDMFMETFKLGFVEAIKQLAKRSGIKLALTEYQAEKLQEISLNLMSIRLHLDAPNAESSESPILYKFFNRNMNMILTFLNTQVLSYPLKEEWSYDDMPIFFISTEFLAEKLNLNLRNVKREVNLLVLLGFLIKLHHAEVPRTLYKRTEDGKAINYYCLPAFDDAVFKAEQMIQHMKKIKFKKTAVNFEYIAVSFDLETARRVFPNDFIETKKQPEKKITNRKVRKKVEDVHEFMADYIMKVTSKKGFIKEDALLKKVSEQTFKIYSKENNKSTERTLFDNELNASYNLFKPWFMQQGYERVRLNSKLCDELKITKKPKRGEQVFIWRKCK